MNHSAGRFLRFALFLPVSVGLPGACRSGSEDDKSLDEVTEATLALVVRDAADAPVPGSQTDIGFQGTPTDLAGMARYPELLGGRLTVRASAPGYTSGSAVTDLEIGAYGSAHITLAPRVITNHDVGGDVTVGDADIVITIPAGALVTSDGAPATGPAGFGWYRATEGDPAVPGIRTWLRADQFEEALDPFVVFEHTRPTQTGADGAPADLELAPGVEATLRWEVGADWPHAGDADLGLFVWDRTDGYWIRVRSLEVVDGALETTFASFGWLAIGATPPATACVAGSVVGPGGPVSGVEITAAEAGRVGVDRVITAADGTFCAPALPGGQVTLTAWGWNAAGDALGTGTATGSAGGDVGELPMAWTYDRDDDVFWAGQGDCDDLDPTVNPIDSGDVCIGG